MNPANKYLGKSENDPAPYQSKVWVGRCQNCGCNMFEPGDTRGEFCNDCKKSLDTKEKVRTRVS